MKALVLAILVVLMAALFWPITSVTVPEWRYRVVDQSGQPVPGAFVREHWQNYSFEAMGHQDDARTDSAGYVQFPERRVSAAGWRRLLGPVRNALTTGVHAGYGAWASSLSQAGGYEGWLDWRPGRPLPDKLVLSHAIG